MISLPSITLFLTSYGCFPVNVEFQRPPAYECPQTFSFLSDGWSERLLREQARSREIDKLRMELRGIMEKMKMVADSDKVSDDERRRLVAGFKKQLTLIDEKLQKLK
jgi:hypothetical protein